VLRTDSPVRAVRRDRGGFEVALEDERVAAEAVVVAAPPETAARICPGEAGLRSEELARLGANPIVNVHVVFREPVTDLSFAAVVGSPVQWVFDRTCSSGLRDGQYLAVSLSAARRWIATPTERLRKIFLAELRRLFPAASATPTTQFLVTRERRATFRQAPGSARLRPDAKTATPGLVLAGAWTATGWPDTMEGAVRSGHRAAELVTASLSCPATAAL
jgi:monoamine oxidase